MQKEKLIIIPNTKNLEIFLNKSLNAFLLPLENYSIGFDEYFTIDEINKLSKKHTIYVIINKFLHKEISKFKDIYTKMDKSIKFFIEDIGLINIIDKDRIVLYENHILSNYKSINYLKTLGIENVVLNNDLTIYELEEIREKTTSKLYYFYITRNTLMHSKRALITNFKTYNNIKDNKKELNTYEKVTKTPLMFKEESGETTVLHTKIFSANKYIKNIQKLDYLIINTTSMSNLELKIVLENYDSEKLIKILDTDYYFLENDIKYKVGDLKWNTNYWCLLET